MARDVNRCRHRSVVRTTDGKITTCALGLYGGHPRVSQCGDCGSYEPLPRAKWPPEIEKIALDRIDGDAGIGDVLKRRYGKWGGDWYIRVREIIRFPCNCKDEQKRLNRLYPFD
jgi:hypothetical protein